MIGFPKVLNSKFDVEFTREHFPGERLKEKLQSMLDERMQWFFTGDLESAEAGITDATHKVVTTEGMGDRLPSYGQYELMEDQNCEMYRLGLTMEEVEALLAE